MSVYTYAILHTEVIVKADEFCPLSLFANGAALDLKTGLIKTKFKSEV